MNEFKIIIMKDSNHLQQTTTALQFDISCQIIMTILVKRILHTLEEAPS